MLSKDLYKKGRFLAFVLRHEPKKANLTLDAGGWAEVTEILESLKITYSDLTTIIVENDKQRFSFNTEGTKVRANQGHSIKVDLGLEARIPPNTLYHGTIELFINYIFASGIQKMDRHHVHMSTDIETAKKVALRRKKGGAFVLYIRAHDMYQDGYIFYCSDNGVWLTDEVPEKYLSFIERPTEAVGE